MLIRGAEVWGTGSTADVRLENEHIAAIGDLHAIPGEHVIEAGGGLLLPGLHDHHIHLAGLAASRASVPCGPPHVVDEDGLARALSHPGSGWIRGIGFHESVMSGTLPDAMTLDRLVAHRPLRLQHRTGRMWLLNSLALEELLSRAAPPPGLERAAGAFTGRLFDEDGWLQQALSGSFPDLTAISGDLARFGITGVTDMSPRNDAVAAQHLARQRASDTLQQDLVLAGTLALGEAVPDGWRLGPAKLHLHEAALPDFAEAVKFIRIAHESDRSVAAHCVSEVEIVFAVTAFEAAGACPGDRIEHVSVASPHLVERMAALGLWACVQPHFIRERGDRYLLDVEPRHIPDLYRLRTLAKAGIPLAAGSDGPYGGIDPWAAVATAVGRQTAKGVQIGSSESLTPGAALALWLSNPLDFTRQRQIAVGEPADVCLLDRPWCKARDHPSAEHVVATVIAGKLVYDRVNQSPLERLSDTQAPA